MLSTDTATGCVLIDYIPISIQTETYEVKPGQNHNHGYSGPLKVSYGGAFTNVGKDFLEVGVKYNLRRSSTEDPNRLFEPFVNKYGVSSLLLLNRSSTYQVPSYIQMAEVRDNHGDA